MNTETAQKSVLLTSVTFCNYMGSELNVLTQASYFLTHGYKVDIFTLEIDEPLKTEASNEIKLIDHYHEDLLSKHYDLVIARQWPLLEYLLFSKKIIMDRIYFEAVSWRLPIDFFPYFYKDLTLVGYASERIRIVLEQNGFDTSDAIYFPNYADSTFFDTKPKCHQLESPANYPKKIVIVSNHLPKELELFASFVANQTDIEIEVIGKHHNFRLVTAEVLQEYDLVISIGKTIFYALAMGIPCYSYDETSTIGYITCENYRENLLDNFASSQNYSPKSPSAILEDIINGYKIAFNDSLKLKEFAKSDFSFEPIMDNLVQKLYSLPKMNLESLYEKYPLSSSLSKVYVDDVAFYRADIKRWYNESIKLGNLLRDAENTIHKKEMKITDIYNSKTWKFVSRVKRPFIQLKRFFKRNV